MLAALTGWTTLRRYGPNDAPGWALIPAAASAAVTGVGGRPACASREEAGLESVVLVVLVTWRLLLSA